MTGRIGAVLAAMAMAAALAATARAQSADNSDAQANVRQSQQYQQMVCSNAGFRAQRIAKECGPLQGSQFYQGCVASFNCDNQPSVHPRAMPPSEKIQ